MRYDRVRHGDSLSKNIVTRSIGVQFIDSFEYINQSNQYITQYWTFIYQSVFIHLVKLNQVIQVMRLCSKRFDKMAILYPDAIWFFFSLIFDWYVCSWIFVRCLFLFVDVNGKGDSRIPMNGTFRVIWRRLRSSKEDHQSINWSDNDNW